MIVLVKTLQVILALSVLIALHELGHFTFAKLFRIRVDKFFLFFDIGGRKLFSTRAEWFRRLFPKSEGWQTEYGIGWLPLGGYCKIAGMVDESMDMESLRAEPQSWEFRTHPAWQRLLVMAGGVLFNFIGAILIFSGMLLHDGHAYFVNDGACIYVNGLSYDMGFRSGDHIIDFDGWEPQDFGMLQADLVRRRVQKVRLLRDGDTLSVYIDRSRVAEMLQTPGMFDLAVPFVIDTIPEGSPNASLGLLRGDRVTAVDGQVVRFVQDSRSVLASDAGGTAVLDVIRGEESFQVEAVVDSLGRLGVYSQLPAYHRRSYNALTALPAGCRYTFTQIRDYLRDLRMVATPATGAYKSVGSFIAIGQAFPSAWDWSRFLYMLALLSVMLGVMNLIPIPGLDGGHILFTIYEMVTGRKPSESFMYIMQLIGMALIFMLMILAFGNDIGRLIK